MAKNSKIARPLLQKTDRTGKVLAPAARHRLQNEVIKLFGTIDFDPNYSYKA